MSREIKFRALSECEDGEIAFEYGYIGYCDKKAIISDESGCGAFVDINTLGQYTGLKDKNDKEIYEGDIVNIINNSVDEDDGYFIVKYDIETARYILSGNSLVYDFDNTYANECEVIGSIYENSELLKE